MFLAFREHHQETQEFLQSLTSLDKGASGCVTVVLTQITPQHGACGERQHQKLLNAAPHREPAARACWPHNSFVHLAQVTVRWNSERNAAVWVTGWLLHCTLPNLLLLFSLLFSFFLPTLLCSFHKCLLNFHCVPSTVLGLGMKQ